jgi:hypothetical protein
MDVRFEDHGAFQRAALLAAAGGAALGMTGSLPLAAAGSAAALCLACRAVPWRWRILAAGACAAGAVVWAIAPQAWSAPACGAMLAISLAAIRADALQRAHAPALPDAALGVAMLAGSGALFAASVLLPGLTAALAAFVPPIAAAGVCGAVLGLWTAVASAPLHLRIGGQGP